ncbi:MAG: LpqB family beta-propeller domain-containing protein [Chloroflexota bacterium]
MGRMYALRVLYFALAMMLLTAHVSAIAASPIRQLTSSTATNVRPAWSPDGKSIAFQSNRDGPYHIYVMNTDGSNLRQLTSGDNDDRHPSWSPDGKIIAVDTGSEIRREIALIDVASKNRTPVTKLAMTAQFPSFSPDGKTIAFFLYNLGSMDLWTVGKDGGNAAAVTKQLATEANNQCTFACHAARWSPDGNRIAFSDGDNARVMLMASLTSGGAATPLSPPDEKSHFPVFLADGRLVYVTETVTAIQSYTDLWIVDPNNTSAPRVELAQSIQAQGPFELNKDGTELLFFSPRTGNFEIYSVTLDAAGKAALAEKAAVSTGFGVTRTPTAPQTTALPFQVTPELVVLGVLALMAIALELTVWIYRRRRAA